MSRVTSFSEWLLRQAFIWGGLACLAFYALVVRGADDGSFYARYFAGHTVAYCTTGLFFVGAAGLLIKLLGVLMQFASVDRVRLSPPGDSGQSPSDAPALLAQLENESAAVQDSYLVRRLREALDYVQRTGSADGLEKQLHHLEEADFSLMHQSYAMTRIILSTIPILGFLGTVIGITLAIAKLNLSGEAMDESLPAVISGLSVAFDTTALALSLSTVLLFARYCVERVEVRLLALVDASVARQLVGRFRQYGSENDPHLASVRRISEQLLHTVQTGMVEQAALLKKSFDRSSRQWSEILSDTATTLDEALSGAVLEGMTRHAAALNDGVKQQTADFEGTLIRHAELLNEGLVAHSQQINAGLDRHTDAINEGVAMHTTALTTGLEDHRVALTAAEQQLAQENRRHLADVEAAVAEAMLVATNRQEKLIKQSELLLKEMQTALVEAAGTTVAQQEQLIKQGDIMLQVVEATGQVKQLEDALNSNLKSLASSHNFQQTAAGLSAALQLMSVHLVGKPLETAEEIELAHAQQSSSQKSKAA
ncbi:MAG: MotA/TolQ/ExbB proton channel family protein [Planctomycetota bacterium]